MKVWGILVLASLFLGACENGNLEYAFKNYARTVRCVKN